MKDEEKRNLNTTHAAYERKDVYVRGIAIFMLMLVVSAIILFFGIGKLFRYLQATTHSPKNQIPIHSTTPLPPEPRLQGMPGHPEDARSELLHMHNSQDSLLSGYGWIDSSKGIVHIPIDSAKIIFLKEGWRK